MNDQSGSGSRAGAHNRHIDTDLCIDLLNDLLTPDEKQEILSHLTVCPSCEKFFRERARVRDRLLATRTLRSVPGGELVLDKSSASAPYEDEGKSLLDHLVGLWTLFLRSMRRPRVRAMGGVAIVAAAMLLVVIRLQVREPSDIPLYALPTSYDATRLRAVTDAGGEDLAEGLQAYADKDLERAITHLKKPGTGEMESLRRIYLGSALALRDRHAEAVAVLETVSFETVPEEWRHEAQWTLFVSLKRMGREASADSLLRILAQKEGEVGERARLFLD